MFFFKRLEVCALFPVLMIKKKKEELVLMHARRPGPLGEEDVPPQPGLGSFPSPRPCSAQTKEPAHTRAGAFLGAMTHFSSQRILGRVARRQVG